MIGLDTNVVIRYLVQDDPKQAAIATQFVEKTLSEEEPGFLSHIVLCEMFWVLRDCYLLPPRQTAEILEGLFRAKQIKLQDAKLAWQALHSLQHDGADFSDALISFIGREVGCQRTVTFDKQAAAKLDAFQLLK